MNGSGELIKRKWGRSTAKWKSISALLSQVDRSRWRHQQRSNTLSIQFEICSHLCYFLVVLTDALLLPTCRLPWAPPPLLSSVGLEVPCPCKVLRCNLTVVLSATLCQSPLGDDKLRLGLGRYGEYVDRSIQWTLHCQLRQAAI